MQPQIFPLADSQTQTVGTVERLVPGRLLYIEVGQRILSAKPDTLRIREPDSSLSHYRGEDFGSLGLKSGMEVTVAGFDPDAMVSDLGKVTVIIDRPVGLKARIVSAVSHLAR